MVNKTKSGRRIKKPVEIYHQNCILKATVMQNRRDNQSVTVKKKKIMEVKKHEQKDLNKIVEKNCNIFSWKMGLGRGGGQRP